MDKSLATLALVLKELGVEPKIDTVEDRMAVQKAVYLGQVALGNHDLGYRYGWYIHGPYCPALTRDYYALDEELSPAQVEGLALNERTRAQLKPVRENLVANVPVEFPEEHPHGKPGWLELLASIHFLRQVLGYDAARTEKTFKDKKDHLVQWIPQGEQALQQAGMV